LTTEALELIGAYNNKRTISHLGRQNTRQILILVWEMWCSNVCHFDICSSSPSSNAGSSEFQGFFFSLFRFVLFCFWTVLYFYKMYKIMSVSGWNTLLAGLGWGWVVPCHHYQVFVNHQHSIY